MMKKFFALFTGSAKELKSVRCIAVTGVLTALFIVLDMFSIKIGDFIKVNFAFISLAAVGMLYGPVPGALAALAGDLIGCILSGQAPLPLLSCTAVLEGLLYGICLYKKDGTRLVIFSIISRLLDSAVISLLLNTAILMHYGFMTRTTQQLYLRYGKIATELIFFIPLIIAVLPMINGAYKKVSRVR